MHLCIRVVTTPQPETWLRLIVVMVILIVVTTPVIRDGYTLPDLIAFFLGAGVAGAQAAQPLPAALVRRAA